MRLIPVDELTALVQQVFLRHGASVGNSAILARTVVFAERDGAKSHGLFRLPGYVSTLESGWVDGTAEPELEARDDRAVLRVDARNGFAQPALQTATEAAIARAPDRHGNDAIRDSHHFGALWLDVEPFAAPGWSRSPS